MALAPMNQAKMLGEELETRKKNYLNRASYMVIERGLNQLLKEQPKTVYGVTQLFKSLNQIHLTAKDIFGIGKDDSGPRTIINVGLLSEPSKEAKVSVSVQSGPPLQAPIEVPTEIVSGL